MVIDSEEEEELKLVLVTEAEEELLVFVTEAEELELEEAVASANVSPVSNHELKIADDVSSSGRSVSLVFLIEIAATSVSFLVLEK